MASRAVLKKGRLRAVEWFYCRLMLCTGAAFTVRQQDEHLCGHRPVHFSKAQGGAARTTCFAIEGETRSFGEVEREQWQQ